MKVTTDRGIVELDLQRIAVEILASKGRSGATADTIAAEIKAKYKTLATTAQLVSELLQEIPKIAHLIGENWHAPSNAVLRLIKQRSQSQARAHAYVFEIKIRYSPKGWAKVVIPAQIIEKLGKPSHAKIRLDGDTVIVSP
jgi:hypothetical protein